MVEQFQNSNSAESKSAWSGPEIAIALALGVLVLMVYGQTVQFDWVRFDDLRYVPDNPEVRSGLTRHGVA